MASPAPFEVITEIRDVLATLEGQTHYERLALEQDAEPIAIKRAYMKLAAKWHPDRFSQYDLGNTESDLQRLFSLLTESHTVLTNINKKEAYDASLEWNQRSGDSTNPDIIAMMGADNTFRLGQQLLERGQIKSANAKFEEAARLNEESPEYAAYLAYTSFALLKKRPDGRPINSEAAEKHIETVQASLRALEEFDMGHVFVGNMYLGLNKKPQAIKSFKRALYIKPKNVEAQRQLRLLAMRSDASDGILAKITSFFKRS